MSNVLVSDEVHLADFQTHDSALELSYHSLISSLVRPLEPQFSSLGKTPFSIKLEGLDFSTLEERVAAILAKKCSTTDRFYYDTETAGLGFIEESLLGFYGVDYSQLEFRILSGLGVMSQKPKFVLPENLRVKTPVRFTVESKKNRRKTG
jgi:hypothetical protein